MPLSATAASSTAMGYLATARDALTSWVSARAMPASRIQPTVPAPCDDCPAHGEVVLVPQGLRQRLDGLEL